MNTEAITRYLNRVKAATQGRSKDVRLSLEEAQELSTAIGELLAARVAQLQEQAVPQTPIEIKIDGGGF